jgi:TonB family protein
MPPAGPSVSRSQRRDRSGPRTLAAVAASIAVNAVVFAWGLSADTLRALRDREQVRQVSVASLTEHDWETNRAVHPSPRVARAPEASKPPTPPPTPPPPSPRAEPARPPSGAAAPEPEPSPRAEPAPPPPGAAPESEPPPRPPSTIAAAERKAQPPERPTPLAPPEDEDRGPTPPPPAVTRRQSAPPARVGEPQQIVELGPDAGPEVEPDESQPVMLADRSSRATRNTVARERQPGAELPADRPSPASEGRPGDPASGEAGDAWKRVDGKRQGARDLRHVQDEPGEGDDDAGRAKERLALAPTGELPRAGDGEGTGRSGDPSVGVRVLGSAEADLTLSPEAIARIARGPEVTVEGAEPGEATALNARRYGEARYIARVTNLPSPYWEKTAVANAAAIEPFLDRPRVTEITFRLDRRGHVSGLRVSETSGVAAIDRLALDVVRSAAPYPPLPDELAAKGLTLRLRFRWEPQGLAGVRAPIGAD